MDNDSIEINGVQYVRADSVKAIPEGNRCVVVLDRGWVFAGTIINEGDGRVQMRDVVNVRRWSSIGFDGMVANPKSDKVVIDRMAGPLDYPVSAELFRVPVASGWGL